MKRCRHIRDNVLGHTVHTAGLSGTGVPLCACFEREEKTQSQVYERMLKRMFGSRTGNSLPNLQGMCIIIIIFPKRIVSYCISRIESYSTILFLIVCGISSFCIKGITFCSDRGYWTPSLLFDFILRCGGDVVGTVAWCFWYPLTFVKVERDGTEAADKHNRIEIPMKGQKDEFYKTLKWAQATIRATCYRSGTGTAISLAMSSIHHNPIFDPNLSFPKNHKWYFDSRLSQEDWNAKAFPVVAELSIDGFDSIKNLPIRPLSLVQGDTVWFIMRLLSLSSSTVDKCISSRAREITQGHDLRHYYETVLGAVGRMNLLSQQQIDDNDNGDGDLNNNVTSRGGRRGGGQNGHQTIILKICSVTVMMMTTTTTTTNF